MTRIGLWAGAAGFAFGLSLVGVCTADIASADGGRAGPDKADSASAGPARNTGQTRSRPTVSRAPGRATSAVSAASAVRPNGLPTKPAGVAAAPVQPVRPSAAEQSADVPTGPVTAAQEPAVPPVRRAARLPARGAAAIPAVASAARPASGTSPSGPAATGETASVAPSITIHNSSTTESIWVYNLTNTGNYSIPATPWPAGANPPADWVGPVEIKPGLSAPVTLAVFNAAAGSPGNRIYVVEGTPFTLPITETSGVDPFYPPGSPAGDAFLNYSFMEYSLYPANGGYEYTIDVSYIDEWSLPIQTKFTLNGASWNGAVSGKTYGFNDFDTVVSQLTAAGGPYSNLVWSGETPWAPQPPATVKRIIGPDKVWTAQSGEPPTNFNMDHTGWVPASYQEFVKYGSYVDPATKQKVYPYSFSGTGVSCPTASCTVTPTTQTNFDFWRYQVSSPGSTPYPIALRTAAILDGFTTANANGVYGFFTYPNDEAAGQFTNIPTAVSLDIYVNGSSDGVSDSVIPGGEWYYTSSAAKKKPQLLLSGGRPTLGATDATDTYIVDHLFRLGWRAPSLDVNGVGGDIAVIDRAALGARSTAIDFVDRAWFLCGGLSNVSSQFVYERATGTLYYDRFPNLPGYTAVLAKFAGGVNDPADTLFVL